MLWRNKSQITHSIYFFFFEIYNYSCISCKLGPTNGRIIDYIWNKIIIGIRRDYRSCSVVVINVYSYIYSMYEKKYFTPIGPFVLWFNMNFCCLKQKSLFMTINVVRFWTVEQNGQINLSLDLFAVFWHFINESISLKKTPKQIRDPEW